MLGGLFVIRYDILDIAAQRSLDGGLIFCLHLNDVRYDTNDALFFSFCSMTFLTLPP